MEYTWIPLLIVTIVAVIFGIIQRDRMYQLQAHIDRLEDELKHKATKQRAVIKGQIAEQLYPLSSECPYLPSDMRFVGSPIDYLIIDGYTDCKDNGGKVKEIILADIKTGNARLSPHQRAIRDAVQEGRVRWLTIKQ